MNTVIDISSEVGSWLSGELVLVSELTESFLHNDQIEVNEVCKEALSYQGKMLRPSLLLLAWRCVGGLTNIDDVRRAAAVVELIHLATLVHDDVLDEALLRRGGKTINCLQGNEAAVILGDYLLSSAFHLCSTLRNPDLNILMGEVTRSMCAGELVQLHHRNCLSLSLDEYNNIIGGKTASLISACCEIGAVLGEASQEEVHALSSFGDCVGRAFQIRDDLLDLLCEETSLGKPVGRDLEKGKLTLPIILLLQQRPDLFEKVGQAIKKNNRLALKKLVDHTEVIDETQFEVTSLVDSAVSGLCSHFSNDAEQQLCVLAHHLKTPITPV